MGSDRHDLQGFQVPPAELEDVLIQHPDIADAGVVGVYSEKEVTEVPRHVRLYMHTYRF